MISDKDSERDDKNQTDDESMPCGVGLKKIESKYADKYPDFIDMGARDCDSFAGCHLLCAI
ncbi:hypothetical protein GCM10009007_07450 [Formosimonas limnophila]|uniref:Uncharacterized protein n=1 Tax=Formosimonas limnophila TaxID=1384487 RepID=A0A8J3CGM4_9BURK|nr:hypothetical protein GCM10009007_07450 [Formosimonas limnophila]